jgi:hypothetical protein
MAVHGWADTFSFVVDLGVSANGAYKHVGGEPSEHPFGLFEDGNEGEADSFSALIVEAEGAGVAAD